MPIVNVTLLELVADMEEKKDAHKAQYPVPA